MRPYDGKSAFQHRYWVPPPVAPLTAQRPLLLRPLQNACSVCPLRPSHFDRLAWPSVQAFLPIWETAECRFMLRSYVDGRTERSTRSRCYRAHVFSMFRSCSLVTCKIRARDSRILIKAQTVLIRHRAEIQGPIIQVWPSGCRAEQHPPRRPTLDSPDSPPPAAARNRLAFSRHGRAGRGCYDNRLEATVIGHT